MAQGETLVFLLLVSIHVFFVPVAAQLCPKSCFIDDGSLTGLLACRCPNKYGTVSPCSWVGHGGIYSFLACLGAIPTDFIKQTRSIFIEHLCSPTLREKSFPNIPNLHLLKIQKSNVSKIQRGAFRGLPLVQRLYLDNNRISNLEPDAFLGLKKLRYLFLDKNMISAISQHAFRGLPFLHTLSLDDNLLSSVPVNVLLQPKALQSVCLQNNRITIIDSDVMNLRQNQRLRLLIGKIKVRCDRWFICNQQHLYHLSFHPLLITCASPAELKGTFLFKVRKDICQVTTYRPEQHTGSTRRDEMSILSSTANMVSTGSQIVNSSLYSETFVTEDYTGVPHGNNMSVSEQTTRMDHVVLLGGNPMVINENGNAMINAVVVPLLLVFTTVVVRLIYDFCRDPDLAPQDAPTGTDDEASPETAGDDHIEPYAVAYAVDSTELQRSDGSSTTEKRPAPSRDKTPEANCTIQPYAVAYAEDPESDIQPYAVAYNEEPGPQIQCHPEIGNDDLQQDDNYKIQPYAIGYPDSPQAARNNSEAESTPLENEEAANVIQPLAQTQGHSLSTADSYEEENDVHPSASDGQGPYGMEDVNEISDPKGVVYKSGSENVNAGEEKHSDDSKGPYGLG